MKRRKGPRTTKMATIKSVLSSFDFDRDKYISAEWQKFGYDLAQTLSDLKNKSLYMKLAKTTPRTVLLEAVNFVKDASNVRSKGRLFMWKLGELKKEKIKPSPLGEGEGEVLKS